ncbi:uncharacterized protein LOC114525508 [Dendronephthya gigantea]|uniref:uncharacterized protein LOC114525508 n=1 Tax=Dendronephthya gigantea TaxID=151771 RepID=UPI00106C7900|nr:uncharacterized protein LOC114525508 [Dendronephthya gigantea]
MAMSRGVGVGSMVIGISLLVLSLISLICGAVVVSKMTSPAAVSIGFWGLYFIIPGVLSIMAGYKKISSLLGAALGTHILGIILGIVGLSIGAAFWTILSSTCVNFSFRHSPLNGDHCYCSYNNEIIDYPASCSDLETVRQASAAVTIIFSVFTIISFIGSIYGCIGTCCAPREQAGVVITTTQQPMAVGMNTQAYPGQKPPPYP